MWTKILYQPLLNILILFYNLLGQNLGLSIILLTVLVRVILLPLTLKPQAMQKKIKELQPELEAIKRNHGHDKRLLAQKTLELYQARGINPLSSYLLLLIQMPILIALYQVFFKLNPSQFHLLYPFVPRPETINSQFFWLNLSKPDPFYILPILAGLSQFWQSKMMMPKEEKKPEGETAALTQAFSKQMIYFFPFMIFFIAARLPSALGLYWVMTTLFTIAQQYLFLKEKIRFKKGSIIRVRTRD